MAQLDAKQRDELESLLREGRFWSSHCETILRMVGDTTFTDIETRFKCVDSAKQFNHTVVREFMDAETEAETQLDSDETKAETQPDSNETKVAKPLPTTTKRSKKQWSDTELHDYWMKILRGTYQLTARRYSCALRIAELVIPGPIDSQPSMTKRVEVVKYLLSSMIPAPYSVFRRRTPLHHARVEDFRRDAMQRMNLTSIRAEEAFEDKYNEEYFTQAVALSRRLEKEIQWLRCCIEKPSRDAMF